ncbi:MAG: hypothetical protein KC496_08645 [Anaerolineae bacterium]|nr:hypothetical protein [Anaerolineae bacterium]
MVDKAYRAEMEAHANQLRLAKQCKNKPQQTGNQTDHTHEHNGKQEGDSPVKQLRPRWAFVFGVLLAGVLLFVDSPAAIYAQNPSDALEAGTSGDTDLAYAIFYLQLGEYELVLDVLDDVLADDPFNASAYAVRGTAYYFLTEFEYAIADSKTAIAIAPDYSMPYWTLGDVYFDLGDYELAQSYYMKYVDLTNNTPHPYVVDQVRRCQLVP